MKRVLIIGAGGVGGYLGARLASKNVDVTFLARGRRYEQLCKDGIVLESPEENYQGKVNVVRAEDKLPEFDYAVVTVKAFHFDEKLRSLLSQIAQTNCLVVSFMNGLRQIDDLERIFGKDRTIGGVCRISTTLTAEGIVRQLQPSHEFAVGGGSKRAKSSARDFCALMKNSGLNAKYYEDMDYMLWEKVYSLATLAAATCLMRASIGNINTSIEGRWFIETLTRELASVASAYGHPPKPDFFGDALAQQTSFDSELTASMLRDLEQSAPTEGDHIIGDLYRRGTASGLDLPLLRVAKIHLEAAERRRKQNEVKVKAQS